MADQWNREKGSINACLGLWCPHYLRGYEKNSLISKQKIDHCSISFEDYQWPFNQTAKTSFNQHFVYHLLAMVAELTQQCQWPENWNETPLSAIGAW